MVGDRDEWGRFKPGHVGRGGRKPGWAGLARMISDGTHAAQS